MHIQNIDLSRDQGHREQHVPGHEEPEAAVSDQQLVVDGERRHIRSKCQLATAVSCFELFWVLRVICVSRYFSLFLFFAVFQTLC